MSTDLDILRYNQSFYIGFGEVGKRFRGARNGYLPPLELSNPVPELPPPDENYFKSSLFRPGLPKPVRVHVPEKKKEVKQALKNEGMSVAVSRSK